MALNNAELERIADDMYKGRLLSHSVYCGNCGYNLRTLPYLYTCPECGNSYNARPRKMTGIFLPQEADLPFRDFFAALLFGFGAWYFGRVAFQSNDTFSFFVALAMGVASVMFMAHVYRRTVHLFKSMEIARRIAASERANED